MQEQNFALHAVGAQLLDELHLIALSLQPLPAAGSLPYDRFDLIAVLAIL